MDMRRKYMISALLLSVSGIAAFVFYCYRLFRFYSLAGVVLGLLPMLLIGILFRLSQGYYYSHGYYSEKQAVRFYEKVLEAGIESINSENYEFVREIYGEVIFPLSTNEIKKIDEKKLYQSVFKSGKILKKKR